MPPRSMTLTLTEDDLKGIKLTGGDLIVTRDSKKYTFHYTEAGVEILLPPRPATPPWTARTPRT